MRAEIKEITTYRSSISCVLKPFWEDMDLDIDKLCVSALAIFKNKLLEHYDGREVSDHFRDHGDKISFSICANLKYQNLAFNFRIIYFDDKNRWRACLSEDLCSLNNAQSFVKAESIIKHSVRNYFSVIPNRTSSNTEIIKTSNRYPLGADF